ncbi:serine hydrolase [Mesorhizobium sp. B2-3-5]|uniref:serine hydrolase n=1 Tax=Mesorhizobium sp. B2-3-5 TaxID=2589958 RepID=UPI0015E33E27|nr:serine hydrolase [Mesorhizobium sp. B2-3-5]
MLAFVMSLKSVVITEHIKSAGMEALHASAPESGAIAVFAILSVALMTVCLLLESEEMAGDKINQGERKMKLKTLGAVAGMALAGSASTAFTAGQMADKITQHQLLEKAAVTGLVDNSAFLPSPAAGQARHDFDGSLQLGEIEMGTDPAVFKAPKVLGRNPKIFPGVRLAFFTKDGDLVPVDRDVIRFGSTPEGTSYWDMIVQPGRVWSEPGDDRWSRASFPFSLVNSIEGETHHGVATFLYNDKEVSDLRFQIVQQTTPYYVPDYFTAWGRVPVRYIPGGISDLALLRSNYAQERADRFPMAEWSSLEAKVGADRLADFESAMAQDEVLVSGLIVDGTLYLKPCKSAAGPLPYCDTAGFGVWSVTKTLASAAALLRLAQKYGPDVFSAKVVDYVEIPAAHNGWRDVTFADLLNMASGVGFGTNKRDPNDIGDGYLEGNYFEWTEARSLKDKIEALAKTPDFPWGPGEVVRYRDQDMFLLGVAMAEYLKRKGGNGDLWQMLTDEVYRPIGIHHAATNRTIESDGSKGHPIMAFGYYPSLSDLAKIATLFQNKGRLGNKQILYEPMIETMLAGAKDRGLPTGEHNAYGEGRYYMSLRYARYDAAENCKLYLPAMLGYGGNIVALMPNGMIGIRLAKNWDGNAARSDYTGMANVANRLESFCK